MLRTHEFLIRLPTKKKLRRPYLITCRPLLKEKKTHNTTIINVCVSVCMCVCVCVCVCVCACVCVRAGGKEAEGV